MSLKKLAKIGVDYGCEKAIQEWIASSVCSFGISRIFNDEAYYDYALRDTYRKSLEKDCARSLGDALIQGPLSSKTCVRTTKGAGRTQELIQYKVLVIKQFSPEEVIEEENPTSDEKVADNAGIG